MRILSKYCPNCKQYVIIPASQSTCQVCFTILEDERNDKEIKDFFNDLFGEQ